MNKRAAILTLCALALPAGVFYLCRQPAPVAPPQPLEEQGRPAERREATAPSTIRREESRREGKGLSPEVAAIVGQPGGFRGSRLQAVHRLRKNLNAQELEALVAFLRDPAFPPGSTLANERALRNDVINALAAQEQFPPGLFAALREVYGNRGQDIALRDYAIQHLLILAGKQAELTAEGARLDREALWEATRETASSIAGTALLGLDRLAAQDSAIDAREVAAMAQEVTEDPGASELARVSAIQVCAARKVTAVLPLLRNLAAQETGSIPLRISALGALGRLGGEPELALLKALQPGAAPCLQPAIVAACAALAPQSSPDPISAARP